MTEFENAVFITLDSFIGLSDFEPLFSDGNVFFFPFYTDVAAVEFQGRYRSGAGA